MRQPAKSSILELGGKNYFKEEGTASSTRCCSRLRKITREMISEKSDFETRRKKQQQLLRVLGSREIFVILNVRTYNRKKGETQLSLNAAGRRNEFI